MVCFYYLLTGKYTNRNKCILDHVLVNKVDKASAKKVYAVIKPGLGKIFDNPSVDRQQGGGNYKRQCTSR